MRQFKLSFALAGGFALTACASMPGTLPGAAKTLPPLQSAPLCENETAAIHTDYPTARIDQCEVMDADSFKFTIRPEAKTDPEGQPINDSPWYGFRVDPKKTGSLNVTLKYENGRHRYRPKISYDGVTWNTLASAEKHKERKPIYNMRIKTDGRPFLISAQEAFSKTAHDNWSDKIAEKSFVTKSVTGQSRDGHPIFMLDARTEPDKKKPYVMWVGRQHPPEVTGALALIPFSETVLGESELAKQFRETFNVLIVPMMNPDGVTEGHWRFAKGGMDLNRDWGPFSQPETQAIKSALRRFETGADDIAFFLDFHSTWRNLLYTQADDEPTSPPMFARDWIAAVDARLDDELYAFTREARHNSGKPISKNYMYDQFGISAITYEVGDETDREAINISATVFAEEMMRLLLAHETSK